MRRTDDWRARVSTALAVAATPVVGVMGVAGALEPGTPRAFALLLLPATVLLGFLVRRRRRHLSVALAAGVLGGWTLGAGIRVAMFIAAEMGGGMSRTISGTVGLILFFALPGVVLSAVVMALRGFLRLRPRAVALLTTALCAVLLGGPSRAELMERGNALVNAVTFLVSGALFGLVIGTVQERVESWWDRRAAATGDTEGATA